MNVRKIIEDSKVVSMFWLGKESSSSRIRSDCGKKMVDNKVVGILAQNFSTRLTKMDLAKVFRVVGQIHSINMNVDAFGIPLGSAYIKFEDPNNALKAYEELNDTLLNGQTLKLMILREKEDITFYRMMHKTGKAKKYYTHGVDPDLIKRFQRKFSKSCKGMLIPRRLFR